MAWYCPLCKSFLHLRRLQLGLVVAACVATMSAQQIAYDGGERSACISHWRMVGPICKCKMLIANQNSNFFSLPAASITRKRTANRIRWSPKCNRCYALRPRQINCIQSIWHWRWLVWWKRLNYVRAMVGGAINAIINCVWISHRHQTTREKVAACNSSFGTNRFEN